MLRTIRYICYYYFVYLLLFITTLYIIVLLRVNYIKSCFLLHKFFIKQEVAEWSKNNKISLVVIGPEEYLANGLADELKNAEINCFGPQKAASKIETDKYWAKEFMDRYQISTARWKGFVNAKEAKKFVMKYI